MAEISKQEGQTVIDYSARDYASLLDSMHRLIPDKLPEWQDFSSETDFGNVLLQLFAHTADVLSYYQDRVANESFLSTAQDRRSIINHLRLIGYKLRTAAPASVVLTLSVPDSVTSIISIEQGAAFATKSQKERPSVRFEYTSVDPLIINWGAVPAVNGRREQSVPVEEGRLLVDEVLGVSDGTPDQVFMIGRPGLILRPTGADGSLSRDVLLVSELAGILTEWQLAETLAFSRDDQTDFTIEIDEEDRALIRLGDGLLGAIPSAGSELRITYRVGGGQHGNVAANSIGTIVNAPQLTLLGAQVTNPLSATSGAERESIHRAVAHAPQVFRSFNRAVTADDYEALALDFSGVGKVRALASSWNVVTLFVAPEGGGNVSDVLEDNLLSYFEDKRPVSTRVEISDVEWVDIFVTAEIAIEAYYSPIAIEAKVKEHAGRLLNFSEVNFGQTLYLSKVYEEIEKIDGVKFVNVTEFRREPMIPAQDPAVVASDGRVLIRTSELARPPAAATDYAAGLRVQFVEGI